MAVLSACCHAARLYCAQKFARPNNVDTRLAGGLGPILAPSKLQFLEGVLWGLFGAGHLVKLCHLLSRQMRRHSLLRATMCVRGFCDIGTKAKFLWKKATLTLGSWRCSPSKKATPKDMYVQRTRTNFSIPVFEILRESPYERASCCPYLGKIIRNYTFNLFNPFVVCVIILSWIVFPL